LLDDNFNPVSPTQRPATPTPKPVVKQPPAVYRTTRKEREILTEPKIRVSLTPNVNTEDPRVKLAKRLGHDDYDKEEKKDKNWKKKKPRVHFKK
jgi:hypothetical protein